MKKAGLSVLLAMSLIDSAEGMKHKMKHKNKQKTSVESKISNFKEGEIIFDQNVDMQCTAGKQGGQGHLKLNCELQQIKGQQQKGKKLAAPESNLAIKEKVHTSTAHESKDQMKPAAKPEENVALKKSAPAAAVAPKANVEIKKEAAPQKAANVAVKQATTPPPHGHVELNNKKVPEAAHVALKSKVAPKKGPSALELKADAELKEKIKQMHEQKAKQA